MSWESSKEAQEARDALSREAVERERRIWPNRCMAKTVSGKRCSHQGKQVLSEGGRELMLCKLHQDIAMTPNKIPNWPEIGPLEERLINLPRSENYSAPKQQLTDLLNLWVTDNNLDQEEAKKLLHDQLKKL